MKFVGLLSLVAIVCLAIGLLDSADAKIKKIKIAKKVAKLLFFKSAIRPKIVLAVPVPLPVPIPKLVRKTVPVSAGAWGESSLPQTSYEIPSLASIPESLLTLLRPALNSLATSAALKSSAQAWPSSIPVESWSAPIESWPSVPISAPIQQSAWSGANAGASAAAANGGQGQQQQEIVEQQQINNYA